MTADVNSSVVSKTSRTERLCQALAVAAALWAVVSVVLMLAPPYRRRNPLQRAWISLLSGDRHPVDAEAGRIGPGAEEEIVGGREIEEHVL